MKINERTWKLVEELKKDCELRDLTGILIRIAGLCENLNMYPVEKNKKGD